MSEITRVALFGKLNPTLYKALEGATVFAKLRGNPYVEFVHWLNQVLQLPDSDLHRILRHFECDAGVLAADVTRSLDRLPRGATAISDISQHIEDSIERAWVYGTLMFGANQVRSGHLLVGMLKTPSLRNLLLQISAQFQRIQIDTLSSRLHSMVEGSCEQGQAASGASAAPGEASAAIPPAAMGKEEALKRFTQDLTERARAGEIDPVTGRDEEIRQLVDILMRRRQNNPILTGEAGVGKTAVVEGFALRIARGDVPPALRDVRLLSLDIGLLQAGASMKGEFEDRLRQVIDEVQASPSPIVLFVDEAHTLIGAGGAAGTGDAANLLKPALARGTLRTIAATTWAEYKKYIEKDPALTRRFQVVQVHEPDEEKAIRMMRGVVTPLEKHHRVQVLDAAVRASVQLSHRYIPARQLPDKSVSLLDTACARVAVSQHATPPEVEDLARRIEALEVEAGIIAREEAIGEEVQARKEEVLRAMAAARDRHATLEYRWKEERQLVDRILALRGELRKENQAVDDEAGFGTDAGRQSQLAQLRELQAALARLQGDRPLILPSVDEQAVASVVADWTGIPVGRMVSNEVNAVLRLADTLNARVLGQRHGLDMISRRIQTARARLDNPDKPVGVFLLVGPSGVGKTETALALAEALYGGEQNVVTINMSEFQEAHTVSTLKGAPPGYVGYGEGGVLTEAVRRRPYSVVLLDEVEKAHPDVHELFFQVFDKGRMEDGEGRMIDFRNTIILLTSNVGSDLVMNLCKDPELVPDPEALATALRDPLLKVFPPALLGRIVTIPYYPLSDAMLGDIVRLQLDRIVRRVQENHGIPLSYGDEVVRLVASRCTELESGGRMIDAILTNTVLPRISRALLEGMAAGETIAGIRLGVEDGDFTYAFDKSPNPAVAA
ncbi:type VI secretion system ATPase TssH [Noviherbaspirillum sp.]|uniref:type VI secretion system ATPase TssH n=1 Tax=Noviherbaspirillum sp. TaxID=1926288 RepID=UPI002D2E986C|nr:type VI secretion system ATPase TssH [Noviherbaspirillum sp.]HZW19950.1 type VI secretion system ATPase TssH [Noviherbaspirillum sp.]